MDPVLYLKYLFCLHKAWDGTPALKDDMIES